MLCCAIACCPVPYHAVLCHIVLCCAILCHTVLWFAILCHAVPYCAVVCHTMPCCAVPCCAVPYHAIPCCAVPCCGVSCHAMPCQAVRCPKGCVALCHPYVVRRGGQQCWRDVSTGESVGQDVRSWRNREQARRGDWGNPRSSTRGWRPRTGVVPPVCGAAGHSPAADSCASHLGQCTAPRGCLQRTGGAAGARGTGGGGPGGAGAPGREGAGGCGERSRRAGGDAAISADILWPGPASPRPQHHGAGLWAAGGEIRCGISPRGLSG